MIVLSKIITPHDGPASAILAVVVLLLLDSGHVYVSGWRTFRVAEDNPSFSRFLILLPLVFAASFAWLASGWPGFWSFVIYFTVFHHIRQFYGVSRWYQHRNHRQCVWSNRFIYALLILPIAAFHFRRNWNFQIYRPGDILRFPSQTAFKVVLAIWILCLAAWLTFELRLWIQGTREPNRFLSILAPAALHGLCFFLGRNAVEVLFPLFAVHGVSYLAITVHGVRAIDSKGWRKNVGVVSVLVIGTAGLAGLWDSFIGDFDFAGAHTGATAVVVQALLSAVLIAPNLWHYIVDGMMWKRDDPGALLIYGK